MKNTYIAYGLKINSFCQLPEMENQIKINPPYDINIILGFKNADKPSSNEFSVLLITSSFKVVRLKKYYEIINENKWKIWISDDGNNIIVDDKSKNLFDAINSIHSIGLGLSIILKGYLIFHAAAFADKNKVSIIAGDSGKGKSTMIFNCLRNNLLFLTDDFLPVKFNQNYVAIPSMNVKMKLNSNSLKYFGISKRHLETVEINNEKYWISISNNKRLMTEKPIDKVYILEPYSTTDNKKIYYIAEIKDKAKKIRYLYNHFFGIYLLSLPHKHKIYTGISRFASTIKIYTIHYNKNFETMNRIVDEVFKDKKENK